MNRRSVLALAPMLAFAAAPAATAPADTPVMALFRRHRALRNAAEAHPSVDDTELDRLFYDEIYRIEDEMFDLPSQTAADMAAKMIVAHGHDGGLSCLDFNEYQWAEARALVA